jgi:hypothetical protein
MSDFRCPICDCRFDQERSLHMHVLNTKKHLSAIDEIWRLRFLFAEAEHDKVTLRQQRDEWRRTAVDLQSHLHSP